MKKRDVRRDELAQITMSLDVLRAHLEQDLAHVRQLPATQIARLLRRQSQASRARAETLQRRLTELRLVIDSRRRTLERLRARMRQMRGGAKPH
jgi:hypothetical protein